MAGDRHTALRSRNYAILLALLDTGLRAAEFCSLRVGDLDMCSGLATVLGKGQKQRTVRVGAKARGAIVKMLALTGQTLAVCTPCKLLVSKGVSPCDRFPHARGGRRQLQSRLGDLALERGQ